MIILTDNTQGFQGGHGHSHHTPPSGRYMDNRRHQEHGPSPHMPPSGRHREHGHISQHTAPTYDIYKTKTML